MKTETVTCSTPDPMFSEIRSRLALRLVNAEGQGQLLVYLLVLVCTFVFLVHLPALSNGATFLDDNMYVGRNPLVNNPSWASARRFFAEVWEPSTVRGYYQPLTMVSLMLDRYLGGPQDAVRTFHRTSLVLHVANTALLAALLYGLFGRPIIAAGVALLFGLHPISVESVCWIAERKTVLATFFALLSLLVYVRYTRDPKRRYYAGCTAAYVLALLSKPIVVPLPAMLLLMDYWPLDRLRRKSITEKIPLFAIGSLFAGITYISQSWAASVHLPGHYNPLHVPLILCHNIVFYLYKYFWPLDLSAYYKFPAPMSFGHPMVLLGVVGTTILVPLLIVSRRWSRAPLTGWLIFFVMIFPAIGIVSVTPTIAANRYAYLPSIGLLMVVTAFLVWVGEGPSHAGVVLWRSASVLLVLTLACMESMVVRQYLNQWQDTMVLHQYMLAMSPHASRVRANLAAELLSTGNVSGAVVQYRAALADAPDDRRIRYNLAVALQGLPDSKDEAKRHYREVLKHNSPLALSARLNLGNVLLLEGELVEAVVHYREALKLDTEFRDGYYNLGKTLVMAGQAEEGMQHLRQSVGIGPEFLPAIKDLAWFLATHPNAAIRDPNEALEYAERAMEISQGRNAGIIDVLAAAYACDEQYGKAVETAQKALAIVRRLRNDELASDIEEHLRLYDMGLPYWEAPRVQLDRMIAKQKQREQQAAEAKVPTNSPEQTPTEQPPHTEASQ